MDLVHPKEPGHGARRGVQVAEDPRLGWAHLDAGGEEPVRDPVVAEGALVGGPAHRVEIPGAVRARLDAVPAPDARLLVHEDNAAVSYTHLRAHETRHDLVCRLL